MNIASRLSGVAAPDRQSLIFPEQPQGTLSFSQLEVLASRMAAGIHSKGLRTGDRVLILAPISASLYAALIALMRLGCTVVFLDPQAGGSSLVQAARMAGASAIIGTRKVQWLKGIIPALRSIPLFMQLEGGGTGALNRLAAAMEPRAVIADLDPECPALITFTGGTTNAAGPRAALRAHGKLLAQHAALSRAFPMESGDIDMPGFPIASLHNLAAGVTSLIGDALTRGHAGIKPARVVGQMQRFEATTASGGPDFWWKVARFCQDSGQRLTLRRILIGGAPVGPRLVQVLSEAAPQAEIMAVYGSTEAEPIATISGRDILRDTAAATAAGAGIPLGFPVPEIQLTILTPSGKPAERGEVGEICVDGEHVVHAYLDDDAPRDRAGSGGHLPGPWYRTGDLGYADGDARIWMVGRLGTTVQKDGMEIHSLQVEAAVDTLPIVRRSALTEVQDSGSRRLLRLHVELEAGAPGAHGWMAEVRALCLRNGWPVDEIRAMRHIPVDARHNARIDHAGLKRWGTR